MQKIVQQLANELSVAKGQIEAAVSLLDEGASVPFIARYRKEQTKGLDDTQLRSLEERLGYLRELEERRQVVIKSVRSQGKLTEVLESRFLAAATKTLLEDLYLPFRPKRRTKAQLARLAGLEPLAFGLWHHPQQDPEREALQCIDADRGVGDSKTALEGARQILMEHFSEDADLTGTLREYLWQQGVLKSTVVPGKEREGAKFADYFDYSETLRTIPSHRTLALFRGRAEGVLVLELELPENTGGMYVCERMIARHWRVEDKGRPADSWLLKVVGWTWRVRLFSRLELELKARLREHAETEAIRVFGSNIRDLLLASPAANQSILGLDPGLRTGVKVAVVDNTGKVLDTTTIYPHPPKRQWEESVARLAILAKRHQVSLIAIGNGTASRETDRLAAELIKRHAALHIRKVMVSEAGASVYSASELASQELPEFDVSLRGAVSIARRLQDPLAELVKIEPKAIGVGQYQHDVNQSHLGAALSKVVEDCVNLVGVDVNTASPALLTKVSGLSSTQANNIVQFRNENGPFRNRRSLLKVPRMGAKSYEQAAGFLRIRGGENPLDASSVHPESYPVVERIISTSGRPLGRLIGDTSYLKTLRPGDFTDDRFGIPTVSDILLELEKPGRDPRGEFKTAGFQEGVEQLADLRPEMLLEGVVTNVTNFGAFVDVGVHQDGLVHISALCDRFVKDPREVVRTGDLVKVRVLDVDLERRRIALSMRLSESGVREKPGQRDKASQIGKAGRSGKGGTEESKAPQGALAAALSGALRKE